MKIEDLDNPIADGGVKAEKAITFYCLDHTAYQFMIDELDANGARVYRTDADGNNRTRVRRTIKFERVPVVDPKTGKPSPMVKLCRYHLDRNDPDLVRIAGFLASREAKFDGVVTEEEYHQKRNPEAFRIASEKKALVDENEQLKAQMAELQARLNKQGIKQ